MLFNLFNDYSLLVINNILFYHFCFQKYSCSLLFSPPFSFALFSLILYTKLLSLISFPKKLFS